ncbi:hypothetical protein WH52_06990 [Tenacibaculum holothuriorum]|uniref:DUF5723 domain-containing protein n=1 Tax=Tenacibaculum holothuriorum TaxID=1635173 RepID=A0A1Y2PDF1_9FLAO|nr:DUF5723 family protein [Tenacibaculum holothuriorum]OSY88492.1 hypothetical protein WH52_06990 [Tenacibaculum holothuriorum]
MKKLLCFVSLIMTVCFVQAQNRQVLYGFDEIPQTMLLNPGVQPSYKYHVGIPLLSGLSVDAGISEVTVSDLFKNDNIDFTTKVRNAISRISVDDYISMNQQIEILSGSYRLNDRDFLSAGFYTELDVFANFPKDVIELINDGNASNLNRTFLLSQVNVKAEALGVLHAGISRKINENFTVGGRFKIYSGIANILSANNTGSFTTRLGQNNIYTHYLNNINVAGYSSGIYFEDDVSASTFIGKAFFGGNLGLGFDVGFTYKIDRQTEITASLLDIGFVSYSEDLRNGTIVGDYTFSGIEFQYDGNNVNYWEQLNSDFEAQVPRSENKESYTVMRPIKFNGSYKYSWGRSRNMENCSDISYKDYFNNAVGAQIFTVMRPTGPKFALTGFYEGRLSKSFNTKVTYTVDDFSATNIGLGLSARVGKFHLYGTVDNIFNLTDIASANRASFQFGMNLIFN